MIQREIKREIKEKEEISIEGINKVCKNRENRGKIMR